jgi:hypothetical protein
LQGGGKQKKPPPATFTVDGRTYTQTNNKEAFVKLSRWTGKVKELRLIGDGGSFSICEETRKAEIPMAREDMSVSKKAQKSQKTGCLDNASAGLLTNMSTLQLEAAAHADALPTPVEAPGKKRDTIRNLFRKKN